MKDIALYTLYHGHLSLWNFYLDNLCQYKTICLGRYFMQASKFIIRESATHTHCLCQTAGEQEGSGPCQLDPGGKALLLNTHLV